MKKIFLIVFIVSLIIATTACGSSSRETVGGVSFIAPKDFSRYDKSGSGCDVFFYDDAYEEFTSTISIYFYSPQEFVFTTDPDGEIDGYIDYLKTDPCVSSLEISDQQVDGFVGKLVTYNCDYSKSTDVDQQQWGLSYFTKILIPIEDSIYCFELETIHLSVNKETFDNFINSIRFE